MGDQHSNIDDRTNSANLITQVTTPPRAQSNHTSESTTITFRQQVEGGDFIVTEGNSTEDNQQQLELPPQQNNNQEQPQEQQAPQQPLQPNENQVQRVEEQAPPQVNNPPSADGLQQQLVDNPEQDTQEQQQGDSQDPLIVPTSVQKHGVGGGGGGGDDDSSCPDDDSSGEDDDSDKDKLPDDNSTNSNDKEDQSDPCGNPMPQTSRRSNKKSTAKKNPSTPPTLHKYTNIKNQPSSYVGTAKGGRGRISGGTKSSKKQHQQQTLERKLKREALLLQKQLGQDLQQANMSSNEDNLHASSEEDEGGNDGNEELIPVGNNDNNEDSEEGAQDSDDGGQAPMNWKMFLSTKHAEVLLQEVTVDQVDEVVAAVDSTDQMVSDIVQAFERNNLQVTAATKAFLRRLFDGNLSIKHIWEHMWNVVTSKPPQFQQIQKKHNASSSDTSKNNPPTTNAPSTAASHQLPHDVTAQIDAQMVHDFFSFFSQQLKSKTKNHAETPVASAAAVAATARNLKRPAEETTISLLDDDDENWDGDDAKDIIGMKRIYMAVDTNSEKATWGVMFFSRPVNTWMVRTTDSQDKVNFNHELVRLHPSSHARNKRKSKKTVTGKEKKQTSKRRKLNGKEGDEDDNNSGEDNRKPPGKSSNKSVLNNAKDMWKKMKKSQEGKEMFDYFPMNPDHLPQWITNAPDAYVSPPHDACIPTPFVCLLCKIHSKEDARQCQEHKNGCGYSIELGDVVVIDGSDTYYRDLGVYEIGVFKIGHGLRRGCKVGVIKCLFNVLSFFTNRYAQVTYLTPHEEDEHTNHTDLHSKLQGYAHLAIMDSGFGAAPTRDDILHYKYIDNRKVNGRSIGEYLAFQPLLDREEDVRQRIVDSNKKKQRLMKSEKGDKGTGDKGKGEK